MEKVFEIYIKTTPERLWEAITDPEMRQKYNFGVGRRAPDWTPGSALRGACDSRPACRSSPRREPRGRPAAPAGPELQRALERRREGARAPRGSPGRSSRSSDSCRLTVIHDQLREGANDELYGGWPMILSGLKTLLETGETLTTPGSLRYSAA